MIFFDAIGKIRTSKVFFCRSSDQLKSHFQCCDVVVVINSKAIFDVLKKIASRSSEIRRSNPLPFYQSSISSILTEAVPKLVCFVAAHCRPGTYSVDGLERCITCPMGSLSTFNGSQECKQCPAGTMTIRRGASSHSDCKSEWTQTRPKLVMLKRKLNEHHKITFFQNSKSLI